MVEHGDDKYVIFLVLSVTLTSILDKVHSLSVGVEWRQYSIITFYNAFIIKNVSGGQAIQLIMSNSCKCSV